MFRLTHKERQLIIEEAVLELKWQTLADKIDRLGREQQALLAKMKGETA